MTAKKRRAGAVEDAIDKGIRGVERIHRSISDLPFEVLHRLDVMDRTMKDVKRIHDTSVAAIYETARDVHHKVAELAEDLLDEVPEPAKETKAQRSAA